MVLSGNKAWGGARGGQKQEAEFPAEEESRAVTRAMTARGGRAVKDLC